MDSPSSRSKRKCRKWLGGGRRGISRQPRAFASPSSKVLAQDCSAAKGQIVGVFVQEQRDYVADVY